MGCYAEEGLINVAMPTKSIEQPVLILFQNKLPNVLTETKFRFFPDKLH